MQLIDELVAEHVLIDQVLGSFRAYVEGRCAGAVDPADGAGYLRFFRQFAGHYHHAREEDILFAALVERAELPGDRGPIATMTADHARLAGLLDRLEPLLTAPGLDADRTAELRRLALAYSHQLWHHIDAENSVILPESETRLRRHHLRELTTRPPDSAELAAREEGESLLARHPPLHDRDILRGDGCVHCPAFGDSCRGLEREWWNQWEWEEFEDQMPKD